jgi:hypothetical protein
MGIVLVNQSSALSDEEVRQIAEACDTQLVEHVGPAWDILHPLRVTTKKDKTSYPFFLVDTIPEAPGALAYHFVQDNGVPAGKIGVKTTLDAGESVSGATSHEAVELQCDIFCASWSYSSRLGCLVATEACDPVQTETYKIKVSDGTQIEVSNFVTPTYFTDGSQKKSLDYLGSLKETFGMTSGGYQIRMKGGKITNAWGDAFPKALLAAKQLSQGRTYWREVTMAIAMTP